MTRGQKLILQSGDIASFLDAQNGSYLVIMQDGSKRWILPEQIKEALPVK